jgi:N-acyl-D-aspartate/D-glutamate deacylase
MSDDAQPLLILRGGTVFDGSGADGEPRDVLIEQGRVRALLPPSATAPEAATVIDASGSWVMPGFVDLHTHYDAELEVGPALSESVRHGITTCIIGSCGLSMAQGSPTDLADMFCRVEGIPRSTVKPLLESVKNWDGPTEYAAHLESLALGPNLAVLLGHSAIRASAMGLRRALTKDARPTLDEMRQMELCLEEALDQGFIGLSINTLTWDKMDGDDEDLRSRPTPSVFATWSEYRRLTRILRRRGAILQGVPNVSTKLNVLLFYLESIGLTRHGLKTMLITMMDAKAARLPFRLVGLLSRITRWLGADVRFQSLPNVFDLWVDGMEAPVFEEIAAGTAALHLKDPGARAALLRSAAFRRSFKSQWASRLFGRAYHRDLDDTAIIGCPDHSLVGKSFGALARARKQAPVDTFLDLVAEYGEDLRWYTVIGNDRPEWLRWIMNHPQVLIGFSDAGAHLRNMAHYNFPLRMLREVREQSLRGTPFMSVGRAVARLTSELADFLRIDAGRLRPGDRADLVVLRPEELNASLDEIHEQPMDGFGELKRLVRRNDKAVQLVLIGGRVAIKDGAPATDLGTRKLGTLLRAALPRA